MEIKNDGVNIYLHCVTLLRIINESGALAKVTFIWYKPGVEYVCIILILDW